jgi:hypothetical protein
MANPIDRRETLRCFLGSQIGKSGFPKGKSGFPNGDGDRQSDRRALDFKLFSRYQNGENWVPKWGSCRSQLGSVCSHSGPVG